MTEKVDGRANLFTVHPNYKLDQGSKRTLTGFLAVSLMINCSVIKGINHEHSTEFIICTVHVRIRSLVAINLQPPLGSDGRRASSDHVIDECLNE